MSQIRINDGKGLYDKYGLVDSVIEKLNTLTVQGVTNMICVIDCIQRLGALKDNMREEERARENDQNVQGDV